MLNAPFTFTFIIQESSSRIISHLQYTTWPQTGLPDTGLGLVELIGQVKKRSGSINDQSSSSSGSGSSGGSGGSGGNGGNGKNETIVVHCRYVVFHQYSEHNFFNPNS